MGNPLKEVELAGSKEGGATAAPPPHAAESAESAEVPPPSEPPPSQTDKANHGAHAPQKTSQSPAGNNETEFGNGKLDHESKEEQERNPNPTHSHDSSPAAREANGGDDQEEQAPLLAQPNRSDEAQPAAALPLSSSAAAAADGAAPPYLPESLKEMEIKYAAYVRHDVYGNWGTRAVSLWEKAQLLGAFVTLCPLRLLLLSALLVLFYVICKLCTLRVMASSNDEGQESFAHMTGPRRTIIVRSGRFLARAMLFVFGFYYIPVTYRTPERMRSLHLGVGDLDESKENEEGREDADHPGAIVSNHVSYLDILYHMSASFPSFVAKRSVARLPLVGLISKCLGCVYVQRESKSSDFKGVSGVVSERLQAAHRDPSAPALLLFPEGTTTNGDYLLPFKTGAFRARTPVKPVILKYPYKRFSPAWDTISGFVNHLEVVRLPVYCPTEKEYADPKLYANNVRTLMAAEGDLRMSDIGLYEKRIFHAALLGTRFPIAPAPQAE